MSLLGALLDRPAAIDSRFVQRVEPLGPYEIDEEEARIIARREACERYRQKNREAVNRRVREWKQRRKAAR